MDTPNNTCPSPSDSELFRRKRTSPRFKGVKHKEYPKEDTSETDSDRDVTAVKKYMSPTPDEVLKHTISKRLKDSESVASVADSSATAETGVPNFDLKDMLIPPSQSVVDADYKDHLEKHRIAFNKENFFTDFKPDSPAYVSKERSKVITSARIDEIIDTLRNEPKNHAHYYGIHKSSMYDWKNQYQVDFRAISNEYVLLRRPNHRAHQIQAQKRMKMEMVLDKPIYCRIVCRPEEIFNAIDSCHREAAHKKVASTYNLVSKYYYNITKDMVDSFVKLCPVCNIKPARTKKKVSGAIHPLHSFQYRVRFQCDLIDFNRDPQRDIDGVIRRWVLVIKDHFTKYAWCRPLQKKTSKLDKHELTKLLNEVVVL